MASPIDAEMSPDKIETVEEPVVSVIGLNIEGSTATIVPDLFGVITHWMDCSTRTMSPSQLKVEVVSGTAKIKTSTTSEFARIGEDPILTTKEACPVVPFDMTVKSKDSPEEVDVNSALMLSVTDRTDTICKDPSIATPPFFG